VQRNLRRFVGLVFVCIVTGQPQFWRCQGFPPPYARSRAVPLPTVLRPAVIPADLTNPLKCANNFSGAGVHCRGLKRAWVGSLQSGSVRVLYFAGGMGNNSLPQHQLLQSQLSA
jgi:hypothetical protein